MPKASANAVQTVNPGESVIFTASQFWLWQFQNFVRHFDGTGDFLLNGNFPRRGPWQVVEYPISFGANLAIPTGGTPGEISLAFARDGSTIPDSTMIVTPAAVEQYQSVSRVERIPIWLGCCQSLSVRNTSDQPILVQNAAITIGAPNIGR